MSHLVTVTGASGNIGKALAERLLQRGVKVRVVARQAQRLAPLAAKGAEVRAGDIEQTAILTEAFRDADAVFAMIPPHYNTPDMRAFQRRLAMSLANALKAVGVPCAVALSSVGAELPSGTGPIAGLHEFEGLLKAVPNLSSVALRPTFFMENHLESIPLIKSNGINGSALRADLAVSMIATRDIAAVAADLLASPTFEGHSVRELLGPRNYSSREATSILGAAIGKPDLAYVEFAYDDFRKGLTGAGFSASAADAMVEMYDAVNTGRIPMARARTPSNTTPTTLEQFAREVFVPAYQAS